MLDDEYFARMTENQWVEHDEKAFDKGERFCFRVKDDAPPEFVDEFNKFKTHVLTYGA
jgi:hypothetical protein